MTDPTTVLVTGATGYIGGRLVPELLDEGLHVRALARSPEKLASREFAGRSGLEVVRGDVTDRASLDAALTGVRYAYYLVHSMGVGADFAEVDMAAARTFGAACRAAGVERIVYLSGLGRDDDALSEHLRSRHHTGDALREAGVPVTELRAAIVVGSGSASFDIIHDLARRLPFMVSPKWVKSRCEPIAIRDVTWYLRAVLDEPRTAGETLEIGSGEVHTYESLLRTCADVLGLRFRNVTVPVLSPRLSSYWLHLVTRVDSDVAQPLVEGLRNDVVCTDLRIREWLPRELSSYRLAVERALAKERTPSRPRESRWTDAQRQPFPVVGTFGRIGVEALARPTRLRLFPRREEFRDYRTFDTELAPAELFRRVSLVGGPGGYGRRADPLWRLRGWMDRIVGGPGLRRGRPAGEQLHVGDVVDWWRVDRVVEDRQVRLVAEMLVPGVARLDFRIEPLDGGGSRLHQLATLSNESLWSGLYWAAVDPIHDPVFEELGRHVIATEGVSPRAR
ncbi:MAG: NmrA family protein [Thermoleophilia bacterium]|nr:NmrA family protein [Thermoleophilia bacterium]